MLAGWVIAGGVAVVATGVGMVLFGLNVPQATAIAALLFLVVGCILGLPGRDLPGPGGAMAAPVAPAVPVSEPVTPVTPPSAPAPAMAAPVMAAPVQPAPVMAEPVTAAPTVAASPAPVRPKPEGLKAARGGKADDLKIVDGIGPKLEELCHKLGYFHFDQVAAWSADEIAWVDENLQGFRGRVTRDRWVPQAKAIVRHGPDEFLRRLELGEEF